MASYAFDLTPRERAALDYFGEELALAIEDACPRLDVLAVDLALGIKLATAPDALSAAPRAEHPPGGSRGSAGARVIRERGATPPPPHQGQEGEAA